MTDSEADEMNCGFLNLEEEIIRSHSSSFSYLILDVKIGLDLDQSASAFSIAALDKWPINRDRRRFHLQPETLEHFTDEEMAGPVYEISML